MHELHEGRMKEVEEKVNVLIWNYIRKTIRCIKYNLLNGEFMRFEYLVGGPRRNGKRNT